MEHIGIDVHKKESQICILGEDGQLVAERRIRTEGERFGAVLGGKTKARVLIEASTESEWVARCIEALGHEVIVADPNFAAMYATRSRRVKTDRRDARTLAEACRLGAYRRAHRVGEDRRHLKAQLAVREALVETRTRYISLIGAVLGRQGLRVPTGDAEFFIKRVARVNLSGQQRSEVGPLLAVLVHVSEQIRFLDGVLERLALQDKQVERLRTVPSVGPVTAAAFVATVDTASRFKKAHQLEAYLGLVPSEMSSAEKQHRGRITKVGDTRVRRLLVQVAISMLRLKNPNTAALRAWAIGVGQRRGRRVAAVALARRLAGILYAMMRDETTYKPCPLAQPAQQEAA